MSNPQENDAMQYLDERTLQRFFDGDLDEAELEAVQAHFDAAAPELAAQEQARLDQLGNLSELFAFTEDAADDLDSDALFAEIEKGIQASPQPRLRLIEGAQKRRRNAFIGGGIVAIAAAASLAYLLKPAPAGEIAVAPTSNVEMHIDDAPIVLPEAPGGSEVVDVEFGQSTGTIFEVAGDHGQPLAVVWIEDEGEET